MKILRSFLAIVATLIALIGIGEATTVLHIGPSLVAFILAGGGVLGTLGISPVNFSRATANLFAKLSMFVTGGMGTFAAYSAGHPLFAPGHPPIVKIIHAIGVVGTLMAIAGSTPTLTVPPASDPPPPSPEPAEPLKAA
jgi:hypothetical protein